MSHTESPLTAPVPGSGPSATDPVDRSQETYEPSPYPPRRVLPSGDVSPDGRRPWPRSSLTTKVIVLGGMGIAAAAATAGAVLGVRAVVDAIAGDDDDDEADRIEAARERARRRRRADMPRNTYAPRRAAPRFAVGGTMDQDEDRARFEQARAPRPPRPSRPDASSSTRQHHRDGPGFLDDLNGTLRGMTQGVRDLLDTVNAAVLGFQSVARQAGGIVEEFHSAADTVRAVLDNAAPDRDRRPADRDPARRPGRRDVVDLREPAEPYAAPDEARTHNL